MIKPHNWVQLSYIVPDEFKRIVGICYEYEELISHYSIATKIEGAEISKMQILIQSIMTEYMKIVSKEESDETILKSIKNDMAVSLSNWFDSKGYIKDLTTDFVVSMERGQLSFHLPLFATPSTGFNHSRIYWSLVEAYKQSLEKTYFHIDTMGKNVPDKDWMALSKKIHPLLCRSCAQFETFVEHLFQIAPMFNSNVMGELGTRYLNVTSEYLKIVRGKDVVLQSLINEGMSLEKFIGFVNSAYYYLESSIVKRDSAFRNNFVASTKQKAGIYPEIQREDKGGMKMDLPPA